MGSVIANLIAFFKAVVPYIVGYMAHKTQDDLTRAKSEVVVLKKVGENKEKASSMTEEELDKELYDPEDTKTS